MTDSGAFVLNIILERIIVLLLCLSGYNFSGVVISKHADPLFLIDSCAFVQRHIIVGQNVQILNLRSHEHESRVLTLCYPANKKIVWVIKNHVIPGKM